LCAEALEIFIARNNCSTEAKVVPSHAAGRLYTDRT
jgi:hypothetical protein